MTDGVAGLASGIEPNSWIIDGEWRHTQAEIGQEGCIEGTDRVLTGVLFAYLDIVTGTPPSGTMNPTVDLQVRLFAPPRRGTIHFRARTLRLGRTLYVGEAEMRHEGEDTPFGVSIATFVNQPLPFPERVDRGRRQLGDDGRQTYTRLAGARRVRTGVFELLADLNTPQGTVGGATLGRLAEMAALDVAVGAVVDELDVRFLNKVKAGPLRATAAVLGRRADTTTVRIETTDMGNQDRLVSYALAVCRPLAPS